MEERNLMAALPQSITMSGGDGAHSYARNSSYQRGGIVTAMEKSRETISTMLDLRNPHLNLKVFRIADFGCSIGPNTFDVVEHIMDTVIIKHQRENHMNNHEDLEFHVFFNDQSNNDFNTLFKTLPPNKNYFVAGVPGSFYGRVLPRNSLHIGHTSYTLHWLSSAPEGICKQNSEAHREQFEKDMEAFLQARAEELVPGGLFIILGLCYLDDVPFEQTGKGMVFDVFRECLTDIAKSGEISEEKAQSFNLPLYFPRISELKEVIEQNGCFSIEMMEEIKNPIEESSINYDLFVSCFRGLFHGVLEEHFGGDLADEIFDLFAKKITKHSIDDFKKTRDDIEHVVVLKRNVLL